MPTIQFSNGHTVEFSQMPSQQDIEQLGAQMGLHSATPPTSGHTVNTPQTPTSPFNPNSQNSQFVNPKAPSNSVQPGTNPWSHAFSGTRDALGDMFVKPEQKLLADAGTRIAQAGVQTANEFKNPGYDTPVDYGNPQRQSKSGAKPLPINISAPTANTSNSEMNIQKPQQQLGVGVAPLGKGKEAAKQIGGQALNAVDAIGNVALAGELLPKAIELGTKGLQVAKSGANTIIDQTVGKSAMARSMAKQDAKAVESTWKTIQPELSKADLVKAVKSGDIATKGKLGTVTQIAKGRNAQMVEAAKPFVSNAKNPIDAVANMQQGIADEASKLRQGLQQSNATWSQNNLKGAINKVMKSSDNLVGDSAAAFKKTTKAVLQEATKADKNLSGLLDVRQKFDNRVAAQYPNIYDSSNSAIKVAVTKTRSAINQMIEDALPNGTTIDGVSFRDSLKKQSLLYDAIDNASSKVGKVGTNAFSQFMKNNPKTAGVLKYGLGGLGAEKALKTIGLPLP